MDLINLSDKEKLHFYAKEHGGTGSRILGQTDKADSYYLDCESGYGIHSASIIGYDIADINSMKKSLLKLWENSGFENADMLATIVSATAFKNMPVKKETSKTEGVTIAKESYESVSPDDKPPEIIYEF